MSGPARARNGALIGFLLGAGAIAVFVIWGEREKSPWWMIAIAVLGFGTALLSFVALVVNQYYLIRYDRFRRGGRVVAQWRVDAGRWRDFLKLNDELNKVPGNRMFVVGPSEAAEEGVEIEFGDGLVVMNDDLYTLDHVVYGPVREAGPPAFIEFPCPTVVSDSGPDWHPSVRVPIGVGREGSAEAVCKFYRERMVRIEAESVHVAPRRRNISLLLLALSVPAIWWGAATEGNAQGAMKWVVQAVMVAGMFVGIVSFICVLLFQKLVWSRDAAAAAARTVRFRNICLLAGPLMILGGLLGAPMQKQMTGGAQQAVMIAALVGILGGIGLVVLGGVLHLKHKVR